MIYLAISSKFYTVSIPFIRADNFGLFDTASSDNQTKKKKNSVVWVRERTIPTERPPLVGEVSVTF
jgi:hypothetical protein